MKKRKRKGQLKKIITILKNSPFRKQKQRSRDRKGKTMDKVKIHKEICDKLNETYKAKNADYGDSFAKVRKEYPEAICVRGMDKLERIKVLMSGKVPEVKDESIIDTLLDLACYCIMEVVEIMVDSAEYTPDPEKVQAVVDELLKPISDEAEKDHAEHFWQR